MIRALALLALAITVYRSSIWTNLAEAVVISANVMMMMNQCCAQGFLCEMEYIFCFIKENKNICLLYIFVVLFPFTYCGAISVMESRKQMCEVRCYRS